MEIIKEPITRDEVREKYMKYFKTMTKAVVDIKKERIAVDAELHADLETLLIENGSSQEDLWGINIYTFRDDAPIEYSALINIKPHQNNFSMEIENSGIKKEIEAVIKKFIKL